MYSFIDFAQGTNFYLNLYCLFLYCFLLLLSLKGNVVGINTQDSHKGRTILLSCGLLLFALTSFVGADFFFYYDNMETYRNQTFIDSEAGIEGFYQRLIYYIDGDYFLFRLIVWGSSLALIISAARKFGASVYRTLFVVLAGFIITYSYARATLAMSVFSMGVVIICMAVENKRKYMPIIIGSILIACSTFFHRSMYPMLAIALLWMLLPYKRRLSKYSLWLFPLFVYIFYVVLKAAFEDLFMIANAIDDESGVLDKAEFYSEQEAADSNVNGYIRLALHYMAFYLPMLILGGVFRSDETLQKVGKRGIWLYQLTFLIFAFATSMLFLDFDSSVLFDRYLYMTFIPLSILIAYMKGIGVLKPKPYYWIIYSLIVCNLLQLLAFVVFVSE